MAALLLLLSLLLTPTLSELFIIHKGYTKAEFRHTLDQQCKLLVKTHVAKRVPFFP